jgi:8-oxo-dGTP pyrophosphatase MutT (NUDIX family)
MTEMPNAASVALFEGGRVLVIQRARAPWLGKWSLPGGRLEAGEDAESCARREISEEIGLTIAALRPVVLMNLGGPQRFVLQVFATRSYSGDIVTNDEIADHRWLDPGLVGTLPTTPGLADVIAEAVRLLDAS